MPRLKTEREDVLREQELKEMFGKIEGRDYMIGYYKTHLFGREIIQSFKFSTKMISALMAFLWLFGKREIEILTLKKPDVYWDEKFLYTRFHVRKKKKRKQQAVPFTYLKKITLTNPYVHYILSWVTEIGTNEYIFPGRSRPKKKIIKMPKKTYEYEMKESGYLSPEMAWKIIKFINPQAWCHLFRHSVATQMAEEGATEDELMSWFDWDRADTAHKYVSRGTKLIEKWSKRKW